MKTAKTIVGLLLALSILCSVVSAQTVYAPDGRTREVPDKDVSKWEAVGWSQYPFTTVYAMDGRTEVIPSNKVDAWLAVGWYTTPCVTTTMYAPDGRRETVLDTDVPAWEAVGWSLYPFTTVYAMDGRSEVISSKDLEAWLAVGWYASPSIKMFAPDLRSEEVLLTDVAAWQAVGWYTYPVITVCALDGRSEIIPIAVLDDWIAVGWYDEMSYLVFESLKKEAEEIGYAPVINYLDNRIIKGRKDYATDDYARESYTRIKNELLKRWYASTGTPLVVEDWDIKENSIGTPEVHIYFRNISQKPITSLEVSFTCYDAYGKIATDYPSLYNGNFTGYADRVYILPGESVGYTWSLYSYNRTTKINTPRVKRLAFSDETTWKS